MGRQVLRIDFVDFWPGFDKHDNWFTSVLSRRFDIEVSPQPDIVLYSCFGFDHRRFNCTRVFLSWENRGWGFSECDWAFTSDLNSSTHHYRLPLWVAWLDQPFEHPQVDPSAILREKDGFASVVVSNPSGDTRNRIVQQLERHRPIASGGRFRNNVGGPVVDKLSFIGRYKFNIAFENSSSPGYTTEKVLQALSADTVPIYWGDPFVGHDFNTRRIVSYHDFSSEDAFIQHILHLDEDDDAYSSVLREPWFATGRTPPPCADIDAFLDRIEAIIEWKGRPIGQRCGPATWAARVQDVWSIRRRDRSRRS